MRPRRYYGWNLVVALGITETTSWGILFYAFAVILGPMQAELGWSRAEATGAFSVALLVAGLAAVPVGHWLDRRGPRLLMTAGSGAGTLLVLAWARVADLRGLYLIWAGIGLVMSTVLYEPAFATLAVWFERQRARAFTVLTLMAGLASTIFVPLAAWLVEGWGWRTALVLLAALLGAVTIPLHALLLRRRPADVGLAPDGLPLPAVSAIHVQHTAVQATPPTGSGRRLRDPAFRWLAFAFTLFTFATTALAVHLVSYLVEQGLTPAAAAASAGLIGVMQLVGRALFAPFEARLTRHSAGAIVLALQVVGLIVLLLVAGTAAGLLGAIVLLGASRGAATLARAGLVAHHFGAAHYGEANGTLALFVTVGQALAPVAAGFAYDILGGYAGVFWLLGLISALSSLGVLRAGAVSPRPLPADGARPGVRG